MWPAWRDTTKDIRNALEPIIIKNCPHWRYFKCFSGLFMLLSLNILFMDQLKCWRSPDSCGRMCRESYSQIHILNILRSCFKALPPNMYSRGGTLFAKKCFYGGWCVFELRANFFEPLVCKYIILRLWVQPSHLKFEITIPCEFPRSPAQKNTLSRISNLSQEAGNSEDSEGLRVCVSVRCV